MTELLDLAIDAAGGRRRWSEVSGISAHVRSGGLLMRLKGKADPFRDYGLSVTTERQNAAIKPYPGEGTSGAFDEGSVRIEAPDGTVLAERRDPRGAFFGLS